MVGRYPWDSLILSFIKKNHFMILHKKRNVLLVTPVCNILYFFSQEDDFSNDAGTEINGSIQEDNFVYVQLITENTEDLIKEEREKVLITNIS
jgi:hypothetical protein